MDVVGILMPTKIVFDRWVSHYGNPDEKYVHLKNIDDVLGHVFDKVLAFPGWYSLENAEEILEAANNRVKT